MKKETVLGGVTAREKAALAVAAGGVADVADGDTPLPSGYAIDVLRLAHRKFMALPDVEFTRGVRDIDLTVLEALAILERG